MLISNFIKIRSVGTELLHAGGRTDGRRHFEVIFFEILWTHLRTVRSAVEDDATFPRWLFFNFHFDTVCWCFGKYSNSVAYLCFGLILCSVFSETLLWAKLRNFRSAAMPCFKSRFVYKVSCFLLTVETGGPIQFQHYFVLF